MCIRDVKEDAPICNCHLNTNSKDIIVKGGKKLLTSANNSSKPKHIINCSTITLVTEKYGILDDDF